MYIIAGLGNPGLKYRNTRHNAGFTAIDALAEKNRLHFVKKRFQGITAEGVIAGEKVLLLKPYTYMNLSGEAISEAVKFYKTELSHVIVMYDDIDLDIGKLRIRESGSAGTHNGMRSIVAMLKSQSFPRIRIGIGKNPPYMQLADYVLMKLKGEQKKAFEENAVRAAEAAEELIKNGAQSAMAKFNGK